MSWQSLLQAQRLKPHLQELGGLRDVVERDLRDAALEALSADRRFATAYNAVLQLAKMVIACSGYRVVGPGHHMTTFDALEIAMGRAISTHVAYFGTCRRKRNHVDYDFANVATEGEAEDLLGKAEEFHDLEDWIRRHHPKFAA